MKILRIVVPTVTGREESLDRTIKAYRETTKYSPLSVQLEIVRDEATCGAAWFKGVHDYAPDFDFCHLTADDLVPHMGWLEAALEQIEQHHIPAPLQLDASGGVVASRFDELTKTNFSSIPFFPRELTDKIELPDIHYYSDNIFSDCVMAAGWDIYLTPGYTFTHHFHQVRRGAGMSEGDRMHLDGTFYNNWVAARLANK